MKHWILLCSAAGALVVSGLSVAGPTGQAVVSKEKGEATKAEGSVQGQTFHELSAKKLRRNEQLDFASLRGKVVLVVNTASKCGYTKQLGGLQALHDKYKGQGFEVVGFPSDDFKQEDLKGEAIADFCETNYGVKFSLCEKTAVKGPNRHPVYQWLVTHSQEPQKEVGWNFEKFLVSRDGKVLGRYEAGVVPDDTALNAQITLALQAATP